MTRQFGHLETMIRSPGTCVKARTSGGRLIFGIFAALAEFERDLIQERVRAGLAAARARGRRGRPRRSIATSLRSASSGPTGSSCSNEEHDSGRFHP